MQDSRPRPALIFSDTEKKNKPQCLKITQKVSFYNIANEASIIALKKACAPRSVRSKKRALKKACAQKSVRSKRHALQNKIFLGLKLKIFKHCGSYSLFLWADNILLSNTINFAPINNQKDILMIKSQHWLYYMLVHTQYILLQDINWNTN